MIRFLILAALLLPLPALADPISIFIALQPFLGSALAVAVINVGTFLVANATYIALAYNVYSYQRQRRAARRAARDARAAYNSALEDRTVTGLSADPPERYFYGTGMTGGDVVGIFTSDKVKDGKTKPDGYKHLVVIVAAHRIKSIKDVYIDGVPLGIVGSSGWGTTTEFAKGSEYVDTATGAGSGNTVTLPVTPIAVLSVTGQYTGAKGQEMTHTRVANVVTITDAGSVPTPFVWNVTYTRTDPATSNVYVEKFLGSDSQTANAYLMGVAPAEWTSTDRLRGKAGVVITLDLEEPRFQGGIPRITFDIEGRDEVFDPRDSTYKYTQNPALCIDDWLRSTKWGFGVTPDSASTIEAANACDVTTAFDYTYVASGVGAPASFSFNAPRYTLNGGFTSADDKETVLSEMAAAMAGRVIDGASWLVQAGSWTTPVLALVDGDEAGPIQIVQTGESIDDTFNGIRGSFLPESSAVVAELNPPYQNSTFVTADGHELWDTATFPFTNHASRVRNLARILTETSRNGLTIQYTAKLKAWELKPGQRVTVTNAEFGWSAKEFRVTDWQFSITGAVVLTLIEDAEGAWDTADAAVVDPTPNTGLPNPNLVATLTSVAATSGNSTLQVLEDGTLIPRVLVTWDQSTAAYMDNGRIEITWRNVADTDWNVVNAGGSDESVYLTGVLDQSSIVIRAVAINSLGVSSSPVFLAHAVVGKSGAPSTPTSFTIVAATGGALASWDAPADADYEHSRLYVGATFGAAVEVWRGRATAYLWPQVTAGTYTLWLEHYDTTGNASSPVSDSITLAATAAQILLTSTGTTFSFDSTNTAVPSGQSIDFTATLLTIVGTITWGATKYDASGASIGSATLTGSGGARSLAVADFGAATLCVVTATVGAATATATVARLRDGGAISVEYSVNGSSSWHSTFTTGDIYMRQSTDGGATWSAAIRIVGADGANGTRTADVKVYSDQIATGSGAPTITGSSTYTWATGAVSSIPAGWNATPPTPSAGYSIYSASVRISNTNVTTTDTASWSGAAVALHSTAALQGGSARIAYAKSSTNPLATTPSSTTTSGSSSFPATNTWGGSEVWGGTVPTFSAGENVFQINGVYDPATGLTTWGAPYLSALKVGSLSAISANLGTVTAGTITGITITGGVVQTATSGARVVINGTGSNAIAVYSDSGAGVVQTARIGGVGYSQVASFGDTTSGTTSDGVQGSSAAGIGVVGTSKTGTAAVYGFSSYTGATAMGLYGYAEAGAGAMGVSASGYGVHGYSAESYSVYSQGLM